MHHNLLSEIVHAISRESPRGMQSIIRIEAGEEHLVGGVLSVQRVQIFREIQRFGDEDGECP